MKENDMDEKPRYLSRFPSSLFSFIVYSNKSKHLENTSETHQDQLLHSALLTLGWTSQQCPLDPSPNFNMDESAMPKLVFEKGYHGASCVTTRDKAQITIVACASAVALLCRQWRYESSITVSRADYWRISRYHL